QGREAPLHGACPGRHFPGTSASRIRCSPLAWWCTDSHRACARNSHERISRPCISGTPSPESLADLVHEACIGIPWRTEGSEASAQATCSFHECSTSCGCAEEWSEGSSVSGRYACVSMAAIASLQ